MTDTKHEQALAPELVAALDKALGLAGTTRPMPLKYVRTLALGFAHLCVLHESTKRLNEEVTALQAEVSTLLTAAKPKGEA